MKHRSQPRWFGGAAALMSMLGPMLASAACAQPFMIKDGQARAQIVIAADPPRTTRLAARELQKYIAKISGATLPIAATPSGEMPVSVYVGQSPYTEKLGITA